MRILLPALACLLVAGCRPNPPPAAGPVPAGGTLDRNTEFKYVLRWPEPPDAHTAPLPSPPGAKLYLARCSPGGLTAATHYFLDVFDPPPAAAPDGPPATTVEAFVAQQTRSVAKTVVEQKPVKIGPAARPGLEVVTQAPVSGGGMRYERAIYALHAGRGYVVGASAPDTRLLEASEVTQFLASFELQD
jgi:hypothetical protein